MKRIIFLRHPQTAFNVDPIRLRGNLDIPLSATGFGQIPKIVKRIKKSLPNVKKIYTSPLARASILATAVAHEYNLNAEKVDALSSWNYGVLNGRQVSEVLDVLKTLSEGAGRELAPKGGESMNDFLGRLGATITRIISEAPEEGHVVIVTHLQNIMMGRAFLQQGLPEDVTKMPYEYEETNEIEPGGWIELKRQWL